MARSVWELFVGLFSSSDEADDGEEDDGSRLIPSPLDLSVRIAHGGSDDEQARALSDVQEQAEQLEQRREQ